MIDIEKYLMKVEGLPMLKKFANLGGKEMFNKKLKYLIDIAEKERWDQTDIHTGEKDSTVFYYIIHTFERCFNQKKIFVNSQESVAFFNTGLMTPNGDEIYGRFVKNGNYCNDDRYPYWFFRDFLTESDKTFMSECLEKPAVATYFENFNELYFDSELDIQINFSHIYDDNFARLPEVLKKMDRQAANYVFDGYLKFTQKKIKRNNRIPVPQFYNGKIMFLIPVKIFEDKTVVIALEKINNQYRGNTVLSMGMAYNCARLLNKPESDWLLNSFN